MKKFKVRVDNQMFYVEVEEIPGEGEGFATTAVPAQVAAPAAKVAPKVAAPKAAAPKVAAPAKAAAPAAGGEGAVQAPMPGTIIDVRVTVGQQVNAGDTVVVLEAMKMENELAAPKSGTVQDIGVKKGQAVNAGEVLVRIG
nr:biotin/lipoyl-containing protein [Heliorestis convoluta]